MWGSPQCTGKAKISYKICWFGEKTGSKKMDIEGNQEKIEF